MDGQFLHVDTNQETRNINYVQTGVQIPTFCHAKNCKKRSAKLPENIAKISTSLFGRQL